MKKTALKNGEGARRSHNTARESWQQLARALAASPELADHRLAVQIEQYALAAQWPLANQVTRDTRSTQQQDQGRDAR